MAKVPYFFDAALHAKPALGIPIHRSGSPTIAVGTIAAVASVGTPTIVARTEASRVYDQVLAGGATNTQSAAVWTDHASKAFSLDASATYLVLAYCETQVDDNNARDTQVRLYDDTNAVALAAGNWEVITGDGSEWIPVSFAQIITTGGSPESRTLKLQHKLESTNTGTDSWCRDGVITILKLSADDVTMSNDNSATSTANPPAYSDYAPGAGTATLSFTPIPGDYLILAFARIAYSATSNGATVALLLEDGSTQAGAMSWLTGDSTGGWTWGVAARRTLTASPATFKVQHGRTNAGSGTSTVDQVRMVALRLANVISDASTQDVTADTATSASYADLGDTLAGTLDSGLDYLFVGSLVQTPAVTGVTMSARITDGTTVYAEPAVRAQAATRGYAAVVPRVITGAGASVTHAVQGKSDGTNTLSIDEHRLHLLQLEAAATGNTTVTPTTIAAVASVGTPTIVASATVTPAAIAAVASVGTPTIPVIAAPSEVAAVVAVGAPTVTASATVTPAAIAAVVAVGAPTITASATVTPAAIAAVASVGTPTIAVTVVASPAAVAAVASFGAPTITASATVTPAAVAAVVSVGTPSIAIATLPAAVAAVVSVGAPTITASGTVTPAAVAAVVSVGAPTITASATVPATTVAAVVAVGAPTPLASTAATPAAVAAVASFGAPTIVASTTVTPSSIAAVTSVGAPTITATGVAAPAAIAAIAALGAPTIVASATVTPAAVQAVVAVGSPAVTTSATVTPAAVQAVAAVGSPTITASATVTPSVVAAVVAVGSPAIQTANSTTVAPSTIAAVTALGAPAIVASATSVAAAIAAVVAVGAPTITASATVTPAAIAAVASFGSPTVNTATNATALPTTLAAVVSVPAPTITASGRPTPSTITVTVALPAPAVQASALVTPNTITVTATVLGPTVTAGGQAVAVAINAVATVGTPLLTASATVVAQTIAAIAWLGQPAVLTGGAANLEFGSIELLEQWSFATIGAAMTMSRIESATSLTASPVSLMFEADLDEDEPMSFSPIGVG